MKTLDALDGSELVHAGVGKSLAAASAPRYLDTENGRVALISVNTSFEPSMMAGNSGERFCARPGINGVRVAEELTVTRDELDFILKLARKMKINVENEIARREGYISELADDVAELGDLKFKLGKTSQRRLILNEADMKRIERSLYEAKFAADYVMISVHSHQTDGETKEEIPRFLSELAHRCIDMGADAIVGHGPHLLRPIEIYNDKPIFYSLGDFILELYSVETAPADFFERYGLESNETVRELLKKRSRGFTVGLMEDKRMMETVIPFWETKDGKITSLTLMPVELMMKGNKSQMGLPRKAKNYDMINRLSEMSRQFCINMQLENDGTVSCKW